MTTVGLAPALLTAMVDDCSAAGEVFQLIPDGAVFGDFQLRSTDVPDNLDIEMAAVADGTPVILFAPQGMTNQKFQFKWRADHLFELRPAHVPTSCVSDVQLQPAIFPCVATQANQGWELIPPTCD